MPASHAGRLLRDAVTMAAMTAKQEQDEALADRIGKAVVREVAVWINTGRSPEAG